MPFGKGPCRTCGNRAVIEKKVEDKTEWLSQEEVKEICYECYERMVKNNIVRIKKSFLLNKLENNVLKFYEVTYKGNANTRFNFGGHSLDPNSPMYFTSDEMPIKGKELKKLADFIDVNEVNLASKPSPKELEAKAAKLQSKFGIIWTGASPKRTNEFGSFKRNEPRYDLTTEAVNILVKRQGFKVI